METDILVSLIVTIIILVFSLISFNDIVEKVKNAFKSVYEYLQSLGNNFLITVILITSAVVLGAFAGFMG